MQCCMTFRVPIGSGRRCKHRDSGSLKTRASIHLLHVKSGYISTRVITVLIRLLLCPDPVERLHISGNHSAPSISPPHQAPARLQVCQKYQNHSTHRFEKERKEKMPVTIKVAQHDARPFGKWEGSAGVKSSQQVLETIAHKDKKDIGDILVTDRGMVQTSLTDERLQEMQMHPQENGLVRAAFHAYSSHQHLVLRPEDIWFAILTQFSFYVNANSEKLRKYFVAHKGKKGLILKAPGEDDMSLMCRNMTKLMDENVVDPELREWILPSFSTTKVEDESVAAIIMMGTLQSYFEYVFDCSCCGIPSVTLLGEKEDWEDIARRIERLDKYGEEPARFGTLLKPILRELVACFDDGNGSMGATFFSRIVDYEGGSGMDTLSGWITVFCHWTEEGRLVAPLPANDANPWESRWPLKPDSTLPERLRDIKSARIEMSEIPCSFVSVPVLYIAPDKTMIETKLLAGFAGFEATTPSPVYSARKPLPLPTVSEKPEARRNSIRRLGTKVLSLCGITRAEGETNDDAALMPVATTSSSAFPINVTTDKKRISKGSLSTSNTMVGTDKIAEGPLPHNTLRPVTAWFMFRKRNPEGTGSKSLAEFYEDRLANDWEGGASTGYVQADRSIVKVEQGLPGQY
ncbi:unnamed protein product [Periconia digitata]|uniref:Uncharacterized protein n=1 Tax=Periconia digitata TaxID=1303443 RepID=A0A9W4XSV6_9PLEO|nr:unnamed protein product [Periconia digitata]